MPLLSATTTVLASLTGAALLRYLYDLWRRRKGPPGPWGLPLVGHMPFLRPSLFEAGLELRAPYGDIVQIPLLPGTELIMVQGFELIREALVARGDEFNGRPRGNVRNRLLYPEDETRGIVNSMGPASDTLRRFSLRTLKNFGLGRAESERLILQEFEQLRAAFLATEGREFDPMESVNKAVALVTCKFLFGDSSAYDTQEFAGYLEAANTVLHYQLDGDPVLEFLIRVPLLLRIIPDSWCNVKKVQRAVQSLMKFNSEKAAEHRRRIAEEGVPVEPSDYTEAFIAEGEKPDSPKELFNDAQLTICLADLFVAGSDTTTNTLMWALLLMAVHSDVQERVHSELLTVVGTGRNPTMRDRQSAPYTDAVIHEIMRYRPIALATLPHTPLNGSTYLRSYKVPTGNIMIFSIISVHRDPRLWARPMEFYPEHFLDASGTKFQPSEHFIPFGMGRRACMGEALARMELFLFFSCVFLNFKVTLGESMTPRQLEEALRGNMSGGVLAPLRFLVRVEQR